MTDIPVSELKAKTSELLSEVSQQGRKFVITCDGLPCAMLVPIKKDQPKTGKSKKTALRGAFTEYPDLSNFF